MATLQERLRLHLQNSLQGPLEAGKSIIITHATRGAIPGLTTRVLSALHRAAGLVDAPLLDPEDAPHRPDGYAYAHAASKRDIIVESLRPLRGLIQSALEEGRVLVAGDIAQNLIGRALGKKAAATLKKFSIQYPCRWPWLPVASILAKLRLVTGTSTPGKNEFARMLVHAHSQTLIARWMRMTVFEREAYALKKKAAYAALPAEEKERRAKEAAAAYAALPAEEKERRAKEAAAAYAALPAEEKERRAVMAHSSTFLHWQTVSPLQKLRRIQFMHTYRKTVAGRQAWRTALKEAKKRMSPETKAAVFAAMRAGYKRKMTAARQAEIGEKKRKAWTPEMRSEAAARGKANADISRKNVAKAQEALRQPECMEKRNLARKATAAEAAKKRVLAALADKDAPLSKKERRTLRQSSQKALDAMSTGALIHNDEDAEVFRKGIQFANAAGAECKSAKLRHPRA